jgi:catechol 2,3-dioxygenase-like lactoylglutathione lyase family enzyme
MRQSLGLISLVVRDYDEALAFFVGTLGFAVVEDSFVLEQSKLCVVVALPSANESRLLRHGPFRKRAKTAILW